VLSHGRRTEHVAVLGRTGTGKSSLLHFFAQQDIAENRGFFFIDQHGDATPTLLAMIAAEERRRGQDLSGRTIVIDPADQVHSVGLNILAATDAHKRYVQVAEMASILRERWSLDTLGVRTEELLRNALLVLQDNNLTLLELAPLLSSPVFRAACLKRATNLDARSYFTDRYNQQSEAMQAVYREAVLNKITAFTADPHFRHILGQPRSTLDLRDAIDQGYWIIFNLNKGQLGEQAATLGSLVFTHLKHAIFARRRRTLFSVYGDEVQNLVAYDAGLDTLFAETRKLGVSVVSANQHLDQYPPQMRSTILAVGTHVFFRLSHPDARSLTSGTEGGRRRQELLTQLPYRQMLVAMSGKPLRQAEVPWLTVPDNHTVALRRRINQRWTRARSQVEMDIVIRQQLALKEGTTLDDWE
jgi:energy-coupling factor transporter ATP-binding protein EcfA2